MSIISGDQKLGVVDVHINPHYTLERKKRLIKTISNELQTDRGMLWTVCGDFNFEALGEKSYNTDRGEFMASTISEALGLTWCSLLGDLIEHHQPDFTRAQNGPEGASLSRIDRIYSTIPSWRLLGLEVRTSTVGHVTDAGRLSDHIAVLSFICTKRREGQTPVPVWTTKDPFYSEALDREISRNSVQSMPIVDGVKKIRMYEGVGQAGISEVYAERCTDDRGAGILVHYLRTSSISRDGQPCSGRNDRLASVGELRLGRFWEWRNACSGHPWSQFAHCRTDALDDSKGESSIRGNVQATRIPASSKTERVQSHNVPLGDPYPQNATASRS